MMHHRWVKATVIVKEAWLVLQSEFMITIMHSNPNFVSRARVSVSVCQFVSQQLKVLLLSPSLVTNRDWRLSRFYSKLSIMHCADSCSYNMRRPLTSPIQQFKYRGRRTDRETYDVGAIINQQVTRAHSTCTIMQNVRSRMVRPGTFVAEPPYNKADPR